MHTSRPSVVYPDTRNLADQHELFAVSGEDARSGISLDQFMSHLISPLWVCEVRCRQQIDTDASAGTRQTENVQLRTGRQGVARMEVQIADDAH